MKHSQRGEGEAWILGGIFILCIVIAVGMVGCPQYNVYSSRLDGEAALAKANSTKQVLVTQAEAEKEAAKSQAEAIRIVGQASKDFPEYRQQQFIQAFGEAMQSDKIEKIIYVPTEANIPIVEARGPGGSK